MLQQLVIAYMMSGTAIKIGIIESEEEPNLEMSLESIPHDDLYSCYDMHECVIPQSFEERQAWKQRQIDEKKIKHPKWGMNKPKYRR